MKKNDYFSLTAPQQRTILEQTAIKQGLPKQAVEKDLWVTAVIQLLFSLPCADNLVFKGGTSLCSTTRLSQNMKMSFDVRNFISHPLWSISI
jgi:predicted nucleotidyltransferase component of viral defense system